MRRPALALALALLLPLAGCLAAPAPEGGERARAPALADPLAALEAGETAANVALLGEWRNGAGAEAEAWGDFVFVMRAGTVEILNVSDPANIVEVATLDPAHGVLDVKVSDDGAFLFVADDQEASGALGGTGPLVGGIHVYDVADKAAPKHLSYQPIGERRGPHMLAYHRLPDGREIVMGANADVSLHLFDRETGALTELSRYQADVVTAFNRDPQVVDVLYQGWAHDMFAMDEPDGRTFMYVANWDAGLRIVDVTDPASPVELGGWNAFPDGHAGNLHTVAAAWRDGQRIVIGSVEVGYAVVGGYHYALGTEPGIVYVWDATDPAAIALLGTWENPMGLKSGRDRVPGERVSTTHNFQFEDGRVYLAHNALGVWVLDVSTPERLSRPETLAYYTEPEADTWDVVLHRGAMITSGAEGVLALHYLFDNLGPKGTSSRA